MRLCDLTGQRFGRLVVLDRAPNIGQQTRWRCACDCGNEVAVRRGGLLSGKTRSCKCLMISARNAGLRMQHGDARGKMTPEYRAWKHIKSRCLNPNVPGYAEYYGGAGITICDAWSNSFELFLRDMGRRPSSKHSIDRIDNTKGYEPGNCRWATWTEQGRNRRVVVLTPANVIAIRRAAAAGVPRKDLQRQYGASKGVIGDAIRGRTWKGLADARPEI